MDLLDIARDADRYTADRMHTVRRDPTPPLVIVGCGIAGLSAALSAAPRPVRLIGPSPLVTSSTALAQGGLAAALGTHDTPAAHAHDTVLAGAYHNDYEVVRYLVDNAVPTIRWLQAQGVPFDLEGSRFLLGRQGGHRRARILHAGGDTSGAAMMLALVRAVENAAHITWESEASLEGILLRNGHIAGVRVRRDDDVQMHDCAELILATGGCAGLFAHSTNPRSADGNGMALAIAAGAHVRDMEFMQFHPTALAVDVDGALPLITEALYGAGAQLVDDEGRPLQDNLWPLTHQSPRDQVARAVWRIRRDGGHAWLDATHLHDAWLMRFPNVYALCRRHGIDPLRERIPVMPAAHFHIGGVATDMEGRTRVHGLYAIGEVACNGVHGADRLSSNSLLEGAVFGRHLGRRLADHRLYLPGMGPERWALRGQSAGPEALQRLRGWAWDALGPVRSGKRLATLQDRITADPALASTWQAGILQRMAVAALQRESNLGTHFRSDARDVSTVAPLTQER